MFGGSYFAGSVIWARSFLHYVGLGWTDSLTSLFFGSNAVGDYGAITLTNVDDEISFTSVNTFGGVAFGQYGLTTVTHHGITSSAQMARMYRSTSTTQYIGGCNFGDYGIWVVDFPYPGLQGTTRIKRGDIHTTDLKGKDQD